jgi:signal transduction histidine kinase
MSFAGRLVLGTLVVVSCTVLVLIASAERSTRTTLEQDLHLALEREARAVVRLPAPGRSSWQEVVTRQSSRSGHRLVVRDSAGRVLAASDTLFGPRVVQVRADGGPGSVEVIASLDGIDRAVHLARQAMTRAALLALGVAVALALIAGRAIAAPIGQLTAAGRAITAGMPPHFPRSGIRDIDALTQTLRQMNRQLADRFDELRRERSDSTAIVAAMNDGIIAADARSRIVIANPAARQLLGYGADDPLPELRALFRAKAARDLLATLPQGVADEREITLDGRVVALRAAPLDGGGALLVLRDLTDVRRLEAVRRDFVANVSHELKTPLTSIAGYAETLAAGGVDEESTARFIATIRSNARRMQTLVDDLLDLSRIESGGWAPRPVSIDVAALAAEAWQVNHDRAAERGIRFVTRIDPDAATLVADADAVRQVLDNLLDNALRYVGPDGVVTVTARRWDGGTELAVTDTGSGIPPEHLSRVFERFYRVDPSRSRDAGGTGLGLAIVRHIVESHGGRVAAESVPREGTTIRCWFPVPERAT